MFSNFRHYSAAALVAGLLISVLASASPRRATETKTAGKADTTVVLLETPRQGDKVTLLTWNSPAPLSPTVLPKTRFEGLCLHCSIPMKFEAAQSGAKCNVCPCGATFADCLTGKSSKNTAWYEMLAALPRGTGLRVNLADAGTPQATIQLLEVDLRTALLPLEKPVEMADGPLLTLLKPFGVRSLERAESGRLLRLNLKENWTVERAKKATALLADHGVVVRFTPAEDAK
jgi:hypothetical protein